MTHARWLRLRPDRAPRRARPEVGPRRPSRRATARRAGAGAAHRPPRHGRAGIRRRFARRCLSDAARCAHRAAPGVGPRTRSVAGPVRRRDQRRAGRRGPIRLGAHVVQRRAHHRLPRRDRAADRRERVAAARRLGLGAAARSGDRWTRVSSNTPEKSCSPATPNPTADPGLVLRVAAASADTGVPIGAATLSRLASQRAASCRRRGRGRRWTTCWWCCCAGPTAVATIEALDRTGLWGRLLPEWDAIRDLPPRDVSRTNGRWTVTSSRRAVNAAPLTTRRGAARPAGARRAAARHRQGPGS